MRNILSLRSKAILGATLALCLLVGIPLLVAESHSRATDAKPLVIPKAAPLTSPFTQLVKQVEPAVVNITVSYQTKSASVRRPPSQRAPNSDDLFERFFGGNPFGGNPFGGNMEMPDQPRRGPGVGSGFIVDKAGYIVTNHHVVNGADRIKVRLFGEKTEYDAKLIGSDKETDLAVIKIDARKDLSTVALGNSDGVDVGEWVLAIGSPFGLDASVSLGIISAKGRDGVADSPFQRFIQTDAAINPGNSGGPLVNTNGQVIGINTQILSRSGGNQGIGFALPSNTAAKVYNQIVQHGKVTRGSIGVTFQENQPDLLKAYGATEGVFVQGVTRGGPAERAGIKAEDVILSFNGNPVRTGSDLIDSVSETPVGSTANITVLRSKQKYDFKVKVEDRSELFSERRERTEPSAEPGEAMPVRFGISVQSLSPEQLDSLKPDANGGVLVADVESGSFAEDIGIQPNDVLVSLNRQELKSADDLRRLQRGLKPGEPVAFRVLRAPTGASGRGQRWVSLFLAGTLK